MNFISSIFSAIGKVFGWMTGRDQIENSPAMQAAAEARKEQSQVDRSTRAVSSQDTKEVRDELAE